MKFPIEYNWLEYYIDNDLLWVDDSLNWDDVFDLVLADYDVFSFLTGAFFVNSHFFLSAVVKTSFLDVMLASQSEWSSHELFECFMFDAMSIIYTISMPLQLFFFTDYQDFTFVILHHSPELTLALLDYIQLYWQNATIESTPYAVFDVVNDTLKSSISEFVEYLIAVFIYAWGAFILVGVLREVSWTNPVEIYMVRIQSYLFTVSRETRLRYEATIKAFFFVVLYLSMMIATFDDDQEEIMEIFNSMLFYFFLFTAVYFLYKYSIHYFAFLEASVSEGRSVSYMTKQFSRDFINTFAFVLRTLTLMLRLNIYDSLDDFYDSYYIFVGDFDDDEYMIDLFFSMFSVMFFDTDVHDDRSFFLEDEMDFAGDLFALYFVVWGKFFFFMFFLVEEIVRVGLALYITYLIIFEVHAVNRSYVEDSYFFNKREDSKNIRSHKRTYSFI